MKLIPFLLVLLLCGCATTVTYRTEEALALVKEVPEVFFEGEEVSLALEVTVDGTIYVQGAIAGRPVTLLVDTGVATFVLSDGMAATLGLERIDLPPDWASGVGGTTRSSVALLSELELGSIKLNRLPIVIFNLDMWNQREVAKGKQRIDGMLGSNVLMFLEGVIDYRTNRLTLRNPNE